MPAGNETYDVFVSYSRADSLHAKDIDSALRANGLKSFFDRRNLDPGLPWVRALEKAIGAARAAIVLIGPNGFGDTQQYERELIITRQSRDLAFPVIPVILPGTQTDLPFNFLQVLTWIDFSLVAKVSDAPDELQRLLRVVQGESEAGLDMREAICPYRGLDVFREEDSAFFFGRGSADDPKSAIGELVRKVREYPFVMVVGRSGSGKSSLIYAGLLPALRRERDRFWNVLSLRPGPTPLQSLAEAFNPRADHEGAAEYAAKIANEAEKLRTGDPELLSFMVRQELNQAEGKPDRLLLYIDQWEELYAHALSSNDRERGRDDVSPFIDLLLNATQTAPATVVATVRADFYDPLIGHPEIRILLPTRQVLLAKMSRSELECTIIEPAKKVGLAFNPPTLVQLILDEVGEDEGMLPLLQYALRESWTLRKGNSITADSYTRSGRVREAIRTTAERTFAALSAEDQQAARQLFLRLVTPGEGQEDTRALAAMPSEPTQRRIVEQFAGPRTRLLVTGSDRAARPTVEIAHESLIRTWPRLRVWIDANREKLRARTAVLQAKAEWEQQGRREDLLLPAGFQLERARALLAEPADIAIDDIQEFIALSSAREGSERKHRELDLALEATLLAKFTRDPHDFVVALRLIEVRQRLHEYDAAVQVVDALLSANPDNIELIQKKAELYRQRGDEQRYRKTVAQADPLLARAAFEQNLGKPISLISLELGDLDFFGNFTWAFQPQVNVLLGNNGYGKSHLLRAVAAMLQNEEEIVSKFFGGGGPRARMAVHIKRAGKAATTIRTPLVFDESFGKVPLLAIPDVRYIDKSRDTIDLTRDERADLRHDGAWHFMREEPYQGMIMRFLYELCLDYLDHKDLNLPIFVLLQDTVRKLTGGRFEFTKIARRDNATFTIQVITEGNERYPLPLQKASQGTLSVLSIFGLIYRYLGAVHQNSGAGLAAQQGIVIIDEIDAHLHPSWQRTILQLLRDAFPNVQFIVTAHSPLVVAGCREREVAVLRRVEDGFAAQVLPQHFIGATAADMYAEVFEIEEKDTTYLRLNTLSSNKPQIEREIALLENYVQLDITKQQRLTELKRELYYLREFEEVKAERSKQEQMKSGYQRLEMEVSQLRGANSMLKRELQAQSIVPTTPISGDLARLLEELGSPTDAQRALLEATAQSWREAGRNAEAATLLEVLLRVEPENLQHLKQLAMLYETMEQFRKANEVMDRALRLAPADHELLSVHERLQQMLSS
jgi:energy-coupling factor transporter ATP-binding protein EcfA2/tetratricopeptide (TPR) repeat protein